MTTILLADDNAYMRNLLKRILVESGYEVVGEASNGDEAIEQYLQLKPEIILLDIVMNEGKVAKTGLDALKRIMSEDPEAKAVICSALDQNNLINEAMKQAQKPSWSSRLSQRNCWSPWRCAQTCECSAR